MEKYITNLVNIDILSRSINDVYKEIQNESNIIKFSFELHSLIEADFIEKQVNITVTVNIGCKVKADSVYECGAIKIIYTFSVYYEDQYLDDKEYEQKILLELSNTAISTTRGVMWDSFRGTYLHNAILPLSSKITESAAHDFKG